MAHQDFEAIGGPVSVYGRRRGWLGSVWHMSAGINAEFTYCGMKRPLEVHDEAPPPHERRCAECFQVAGEIEKLARRK